MDKWNFTYILEGYSSESLNKYPFDRKWPHVNIYRIRIKRKTILYSDDFDEQVHPFKQDEHEIDYQEFSKEKRIGGGCAEIPSYSSTSDHENKI